YATERARHVRKNDRLLRIPKTMLLKTRVTSFLLFMSLPFLATANQAASAAAPGVKVTEDRTFISHAQLMALGLHNHDSMMPTIPRAEGDYWMYLSEGGATDGKHSNVFRLRTDLATYDPASLEKVP